MVKSCVAWLVGWWVYQGFASRPLGKEEAEADAELEARTAAVSERVLKQGQRPLKKLPLRFAGRRDTNVVRLRQHLGQLGQACLGKAVLISNILEPAMAHERPAKSLVEVELGAGDGPLRSSSTESMQSELPGIGVYQPRADQRVCQEDPVAEVQWQNQQKHCASCRKTARQQQDEASPKPKEHMQELRFHRTLGNKGLEVEQGGRIESSQGQEHQ